MVKIIENYCLNQQIGQGQYGKVYKGSNLTTKAQVAIKVIPADKFKEMPKLQECTINQIDTLSRMKTNPHIVKFIEILKTANNYYFIYQYCNGGTLQKVLKEQGHLSQRVSINYLRNLLSAFKSLSKSNIMHRDIKPGNILFHNGVLKLADFGFCKSLQSSKDLTHTMLGSPIYMAPQVLKGQIYTIKADIWSLGVVLYEMLFGFCPFQQSSIAKLINLLEESPVKIFRQINPISKNTQDLLLRMLVKDQNKRMTWQELFQEYQQQQKISHPSRQPYLSTQKIKQSSTPLNQISLNQGILNFKKKNKVCQEIIQTKLKKGSLAARHNQCLLMAKRLHTLSWCYHPSPGIYIQILINNILVNLIHPQKIRLREMIQAQEKALKQGGANPQIKQCDWKWIERYYSQLKQYQNKAFQSSEQCGRQVVLHIVDLLQLCHPSGLSKDRSKLNKLQLIRLVEKTIQNM